MYNVLQNKRSLTVGIALASLAILTASEIFADGDDQENVSVIFSCELETYDPIVQEDGTIVCLSDEDHLPQSQVILRSDCDEGYHLEISGTGLPVCVPD